MDTTENFRTKLIEPYKTRPSSHQRNLNKTSHRHSLLNIEEDRNKSSQIEGTKYRDAGTQTEEQYFNPNIQLMETTIKNLFDRIKALEAQLKPPLDQSVDEASFETAERDLDISYESNDRDPDFEMVNFNLSEVTIS